MEHIASVDPYRFIVAFSIVMALAGLGVWLAGYLGFMTPFKFRRQENRRLSVLETIDLDSKRRLVLVRRDNVEHLICTGGAADVIIESYITNNDAFTEETILSSITEIQDYKRTVGDL